MKHIRKKSIAPLKPATGSISDTTNIGDKITNTYSARIIDTKTANSILVDSIIGYDGEEIPQGYEEVEYNGGIETIINENGKAIKFPDGTMICTAEIVHPTLNCTTAYGEYYYFGSVIWNFPAQFIELPDFSFGAISFGQIGFVSQASLSEKMSAFNVCLPKSYTRTDAKMRYFAVGRWK